MRMGSYELLELLGRGGMGAVYRARHHETGQTVAVKVMAAEMAADPILLRRFQQECSIALRLHHPHIVAGLDFGVEDGKPFLVMEFIEGQNLGRRVREQGPMAEGEALNLVRQVGDALTLAHQEKLIHRDVKPENILLTRDGLAKLTDLGLSKDLDAGAELTRTRTTLGTAVFMAPEQFDDAKRADVRCDVYGLAATLYYILTGAMPFQGRGNLSIMAKKIKNEFAPPRRLVPALQSPINRAICQALDVDPDRRPGSCQEFVALLTSPAEATNTPEPGEPESVAAAEPNEAPENRRGARRHPCALPASCAPLQGGLRQWPGEVLDISLSGLHLQLDRRFEPGAVLRVEVVDAELAVIATWLVRVRWVREVSARRWSLGGSFNQALSAAELDTFLDALPPTVVVQERP
jgi:serine/threonine protein kinase